MNEETGMNSQRVPEEYPEKYLEGEVEVLVSTIEGGDPTTIQRTREVFELVFGVDTAGNEGETEQAK